jgi:hypothetical protein
MNSPPRPSDDSALRATAAQWTIRRDRGLSATVSIDYELWLAADPRHAAALQRSAAAWDDCDLEQGVGVFEVPPGDCVPGLVVVVRCQDGDGERGLQSRPR